MLSVLSFSLPFCFSLLLPQLFLASFICISCSPHLLCLFFLYLSFYSCVLFSLFLLSLLILPHPAITLHMYLFCNSHFICLLLLHSFLGLHLLLLSSPNSFFLNNLLLLFHLSSVSPSIHTFSVYSFVSLFFSFYFLFLSPLCFVLLNK